MRQRHSVGTCLRHVSNALIHCRLHRNMPKACPYVMMTAKFERLFILSNTNLDFWRLVFRRRREVFILLAMPPTSLERAALVMWCGWFKLQPQTTNQRDGSFGLPLAYTNQKNRPFGLWFMWFAWNQTCHSTNDRCEALASLKGCFLFQCPPVFILWTEINPNDRFGIKHHRKHWFFSASAFTG